LIPGSTAHVEIVQLTREDHLEAARSLIHDPEILGRVEREIEFECNRLENFLNAAQVTELLGTNLIPRSSMKLVPRRKILSSVPERN
jgi:hypothetical protein